MVQPGVQIWWFGAWRHLQWKKPWFGLRIVTKTFLFGHSFFTFGRYSLFIPTNPNFFILLLACQSPLAGPFLSWCYFSFFNLWPVFFFKTLRVDHNFFIFSGYYINNPTNNPTFSFFTPCLSVPADRLIFFLPKFSKCAKVIYARKWRNGRRARFRRVWVYLVWVQLPSSAFWAGHLGWSALFYVFLLSK